MDIEDYIGMTFNKLTVFGVADDYVDNNGRHYKRLKCKCSCGSDKIVVARPYALKSGHVKSCGCIKEEIWKEKYKNTCFKKQFNEYDLSGDYGVGFCHNTGKEFYFDLEDYDKIKDYCWSEHISLNYTRLQATDVETKKVITMSHLLGFKNYDHIDRNPLNNCKNNFRKATRSQQCQNRNVFSNSSSQIMGVSWIKTRNVWVARIQLDKTRKHLGTFNTKEDAIRARLRAEKEYFGEFAPQKHLFDEYNI